MPANSDRSLDAARCIAHSLTEDRPILFMRGELARNHCQVVRLPVML